jgi:uncharacterized protein DUF6920
MTAWQYNSGTEPARMVRIRLRLAGIVPMTGWDTYVHGKGRMHSTVRRHLADIQDRCPPSRS